MERIDVVDQVLPTVGIKETQIRDGIIRRRAAIDIVEGASPRPAKDRLPGNPEKRAIRQAPRRDRASAATINHLCLNLFLSPYYKNPVRDCFVAFYTIPSVFSNGSKADFSLRFFKIKY